MARWRRWVFEVSAPSDEFSRLFQRALQSRAVEVAPGARFDFTARAFGARAYVKLDWADAGLEAVVKVKSGLFASPEALERTLLEAGREAQARLGAPPP